MAEKTFTAIGQTHTQDVANNKYSSNAYYTLRLSAILNSINETALKANVTLKAILISRYIAWIDDTIEFKVAVDGVTKGSEKASSGGNSESSSTAKTYVTWTGDIPYNEDGTLTATLTASTSDKNGVYSPPNQTAEIVATFPSIDICNMRIGVDGVVTEGKAYIGVDGVPRECDVYVGVDGVPKKCG